MARMKPIPRSTSGLIWLTCAAVFASPAGAGETWWRHDPNSPGEWFVETHWTDGVPAAADSAFVDNGGIALIASGDAEPSYECVGCEAAGTIRQTGGTNTVVLLDIGCAPGAEGAYELAGTGQLQAECETVGLRGRGAITQTGGTNTVGCLRLAYVAGSNGTYELSGTAVLSVPGAGREEYVGYRGTGTFTQTGGTHTLIGADLYVGYRGRGTYELSGAGWLSAAGEYVGHSAEGSFLQTAGTNTAAELYLGHDANGSGAYELGGTGQLSAGSESIGRRGIGRLIQSGGTNTADSLRLGDDCDGNGAYELSGGDLSADWQYVGCWGAGRFTQTGGMNAAARELVVADASGSDGRYELREGHLSADIEHVGRGGAGRFTQVGGTGKIGSLYLGYGSSGEGTYELAGSGRLEADDEYVGYEGTGRFLQTGGTNTVGGVLSVACDAGADGTYEMRGGELIAGALHLGPSGRFDLTGGVFQTARVLGDLVNDGGTFAPCGRPAPAEIDGNYTQNAGTLRVGISGTGPGEQDVLSVGGDAALGGVLLLERTDGFEPQYGDAFTVLQAGGSLVAAFERIEGVELAPDMSLAVLFDANAILAVAALPGDADVDGDVDRLDFAALEENFGRRQADWSHGDFNGDARVDFRDYLTWKGHANDAIPLFSSPPCRAPIPEPGSFLLLAAGGAALLRGSRGPRRGW